MNQFLTPQDRDALKVQHRNEHDKHVFDRIKAVKQHIQEYLESRKLKPENGGSSSKLSEEKTTLLIQHLQQHTYLCVKDVIAYGVSCIIQGMTDWLHAHRFSYKKLEVVPGKADKVTQERWLNQYEELKVGLQSDETLNSFATIGFLKDIEAAYPLARKVYARYFRNNDVQADIRSSKIEMQFLPPLIA